SATGRAGGSTGKLDPWAPPHATSAIGNSVRMSRMYHRRRAAVERLVPSNGAACSASVRTILRQIDAPPAFVLDELEARAAGGRHDLDHGALAALLDDGDVRRFGDAVGAAD